MSNFAYAAVPQWQIVPNESVLTFSATQNEAPVTGKFTAFSGDIQFDPNNLKESQATIIVNMSSVTTAYKEVADTLKTSDWFDIAHFPQAVFKSSQWKKVGNNQFDVEGQLTLRQATMPIVLHITLEAYSPNKMARVKGTVQLNRSVFGVGQGEWANTNEIKDNVAVEFTVVAKGSQLK